MKCNWCPNEIEGSPTSNGNSKFCSKKCMNEFYAAYPNQKQKDDKNQKSKNAWSNFIGWVVIIGLILALIVGNNQNTTGEQVSKTDVGQVSETEIYPEERYEPIPETESYLIIKRYNDNWFEYDANNTYNWTEYKNNDSLISYSFTKITEDEDYFQLKSDDREILLKILKNFGMSYIWN